MSFHKYSDMARLIQFLLVFTLFPLRALATVAIADYSPWWTAYVAALLTVIVVIALPFKMQGNWKARGLALFEGLIASFVFMIPAGFCVGFFLMPVLGKFPFFGKFIDEYGDLASTVLSGIIFNVALVHFSLSINKKWQKGFASKEK